MKPNQDKFFDVYLVTDVWDIDLSTIIKKSREELTDDHIQYIMYQIFRALQYLHSANIIHRDIKPSNILANESCDVCLCDFGFAREVNCINNDLTEYVVTRYYRAPEVMLSSQQYNYAIDIWSVGCSFYELLVGKPLFQSKHYLELLKKMVASLGTPNQDTLDYIQNEHAVKFLKTLKYIPPRKISTTIQDYENKKALDLLDCCLIFDPRKRCSAEQAMRHPYFADIFDESHVISNFTEVNFEFENEQKISFESLKCNIMKEVASLNKENGENVEQLSKLLDGFKLD